MLLASTTGQAVGAQKGIVAQVVANLPDANHRLLKELVIFLAEVAQYSAENKFGYPFSFAVTFSHRISAQNDLLQSRHCVWTESGVVPCRGGKPGRFEALCCILSTCPILLLVAAMNRINTFTHVLLENHKDYFA